MDYDDAQCAWLASHEVQRARTLKLEGPTPFEAEIVTPGPNPVGGKRCSVSVFLAVVYELSKSLTLVSKSPTQQYANPISPAD